MSAIDKRFPLVRLALPGAPGVAIEKQRAVTLLQAANEVAGVVDGVENLRRGNGERLSVDDITRLLRIVVAEWRTLAQETEAT